MVEQSAVVQRALDALRALCVAEPEPDRIASRSEAALNLLNALTYHQSIPPRDLRAGQHEGYLRRASSAHDVTGRWTHCPARCRRQCTH